MVNRGETGQPSRRKARWTKRLTRGGNLALLIGALAACGPIQSGDLFDPNFWANTPGRENSSAELGLAELAKGNYVTAEGEFNRALAANPKDVHALIGLGILYQNNGQITRAREMYEAVLAVRPDDTQQFVVWNNTETRPISEIASVNLALLESGGVLTDLGRPGGMAPASGGGAMDPFGAGPSGGGGTALLGRGAPPGMAGSTGGFGAPMANGQVGGASGMQPAGVNSTNAAALLSDADRSVVSRFGTLAALRDQGLITQDEFNIRRQANLGALLPLTTPPPAAGLDRPVPGAEQISARLRAIGRALELRAMTVSQHAAERSMILDALMPSAPVMVANPTPPPQGLMQAADSVRRLEVLRDQGFISSDEYTRERSAVEMAMQPRPPQGMTAPAGPNAAAPGANSAQMAAGEAMAKPSSGPRPGVHLASYRSEKAARDGWAQLKKNHPQQLGSLSMDIARVNMGAGKGTFYRLKAGPLTSASAAKDLCSQLKRRRQYCEPSTVNGAG
ncbi:MAG: SHOCT domain-containing protein [Magnetovibrionaceae bacterium]